MVRSPVTFQCLGSRGSTRVLVNVIVGWSLPPSRSASMSRLMRRSLVTSTLATGIDALTDDAAGRPASSWSEHSTLECTGSMVHVGSVVAMGISSKWILADDFPVVPLAKFLAFVGGHRG